VALLTLAGPGFGQDHEVPTYRLIDTVAEAYLHYSLGRLMEVRGLLSDALVQFRRADSIDPGHCEVEIAIGRVLLALGESRDARDKTADALESCPDEPEALSVFATASMLLGEPSEAARVLDGPARRPEAPEELVVILAQSLVAQGRTDEAIELYGARASTDSLSARIAYLRAQALLSDDHLDEALDELARARRLDPANRAVQASLGRLLVASGRQREGVEVLEELLSEAPGLEGEYVALARGYSVLEEHGRAVAALEEGIEVLGRTPSLMSALGSVRFDTGDVEGAIEAYERVLELEPDSVQALNFIAYTLADEDLDPGRALGYAERAVELAPDNGYVRDTLGWTYFKLGRFDEARDALEAAIELGGRESVVFEHLGDALEALGLVDEAVGAWSRALEIEPGRQSSIERIEAAAAAGDREGGP
jgi:tetratricopeptide (TPR) repeat protein